MEGAGATGEDTVRKRTGIRQKRLGTFFLGVEHIKINKSQRQELDQSDFLTV